MDFQILTKESSKSDKNIPFNQTQEQAIRNMIKDRANTLWRRADTEGEPQAATATTRRQDSLEIILTICNKESQSNSATEDRCLIQHTADRSSQLLVQI